MKKLILHLTLLGVAVLTALLLTGCSVAESALKDGYYTAEMEEYSRGWREYVTICVNGGEIASVEYNAINASGFIKAWDMAYMRNMSKLAGMYPNRYTREYGKQLLEEQSGSGIDTVSGATSSGNYFRLLSATVLDMAARGDSDIVIVKEPKEE